MSDEDDERVRRVSRKRIRSERIREGRGWWEWRRTKQVEEERGREKGEMVGERQEEDQQGGEREKQEECERRKEVFWLAATK